MNRAFRGITIDWNDEYENAFEAICVKCDFDLNGIDESDLQDEKYFDESVNLISTLFGILSGCVNKFGFSEF
jgi:hypothetical protein